MDNIDLTTAFALYAKAEIVYKGRAESFLAEGNYLVIYKNDRSVSVHGGDFITPRNYMGSGSRVHQEGDNLIFSRKREIVTVKIVEIISHTLLSGWSEERVEMRKTEKELALKIYNNWVSYFPGEFSLVAMEHPTALGPIDIFGATSDHCVIVEVKRKHGGLAHVSQLARYKDAFPLQEVKLVLACPSIGKNALAYLETIGGTWLQVDFDEI